MFGLFQREKDPDRPGLDFCMEVADVFSIRGRGSVVTGTVQRGRVRVGDRVLVTGPSGSFRARVDGIEAFRQMLTETREGEQIGVLLRGVEHDRIAPGDILTAG